MLQSSHTSAKSMQSSSFDFDKNTDLWTEKTNYGKVQNTYTVTTSLLLQVLYCVGGAQFFKTLPQNKLHYLKINEALVL